MSDLLVGRCPTCRSVVEVPRSKATRPVSDGRDDLQHRGSAEAGGFGAWYELWSVECPVCLCKTAKVTGVDGRTQQHVLGPRVYLTKKGGGS